jgi:hypothetical protein
MSQSFWESEPVEELEPEVQQAELLEQTGQLEPEELPETSELLEPADQQPEQLEPASEAAAEESLAENLVEFIPEPEQPNEGETVCAEQPAPDSVSGMETAPESEPATRGPEVLAMTVDEFTALEDRVLRAVNLVKRERLTRLAIEEIVAQLEAQLAEQRPKIDQLQAEVHTLRTERDQVRQRVERLLAQLDALEL